MTPTPAALSAAEEIYNWEGLSMPLVRELAEIIDRHMAAKPVTAEDVTAFVKLKLSEMRAVCPGYITFTVDAVQLNGEAPVYSKFRAYSANTPSFEGSDPDEIIQKLIKEADGRSESDMLRKQAADLLEKAAILDSKREPKGGAA